MLEQKMDIYKIKYAEEFYQDSVDVGIGIIPEVDGIWIDKEHFSYIEKSKITNHDFNIIKLIQAGDYVNGDKVIKKLNDYLMVGTEFINQGISNELIETIVTKEQFKAMEYKVGGEDEQSR